jgi:hypothetical protein
VEAFKFPLKVLKIAGSDYSGTTSCIYFPVLITSARNFGAFVAVFSLRDSSVNVNALLLLVNVK